jgi:copper(I)-binding protein
MNPTISGNLNVQNYQIYSNVSPVVSFTSNIAINQTTTAPTSITGNTVVYAQTPGAGNTGLYVTNSNQTQQQQELITKNKAIAYALFM